jgi:quinol monooxygenase YgiN
MSDKVAMIASMRPKEGGAIRLRGILKSMLEPTHREPGCITYNLHEQAVGAEITFSFYEVWRSQEDLDRHMQTEHVHRLTDRLHELVEGVIELEDLTLLES